jgi:hypothetical protein
MIDFKIHNDFPYLENMNAPRRRSVCGARRLKVNARIGTGPMPRVALAMNTQREFSRLPNGATQ